MVFIDTHTHLYLSAFDSDRDQVISRALNAGVLYMILPNIDVDSIDSLHALADRYPASCLPMMGLHPTSVKDDWEYQMQIITQRLNTQKYTAVGEIGIDLYWDTTYREQQEEAFRLQVRMASQMALPVAIHSRNSMDIILDILEDMGLPGLGGVFHCFSGDIQQARRAMALGFYLGIGGVVTYQKSGLAELIKDIPLAYLLLETDAPFLAPIPFRGKRNESMYILNIAQAIAQAKQISLEEVAEISTASAIKIFNIDTTQQA